MVEDAPPAPDGASASKSRNGNRLVVETEIDGCFAALDALTPYVTCRREQADHVRRRGARPPPPRARSPALLTPIEEPAVIVAHAADKGIRS